MRTASKNRILVASSDECVAITLARLLAGAGYNATTTHLEADALSLTRDLIPDIIIISELGMGEGSEFGFVCALRLRFPESVVVAVSSDYQPSHRIVGRLSANSSGSCAKTIRKNSSLLSLN